MRCQYQPQAILRQVMVLVKVLCCTNYLLNHISHHPCYHIIPLDQWDSVFVGLVPPWGWNFLPHLLLSGVIYHVYLFTTQKTSEPSESSLDQIMKTLYPRQSMALDLDPTTICSTCCWTQILLVFYLEKPPQYLKFIFSPPF